MSMSSISGLHRRVASAAWADAGRDAVRGVTIVASKLLALTGFLVLSAGFALVVSEQARDRAVAVALDTLGVQSRVEANEAPPLAAPPRPNRWNEWLAASPAAARLEPEQEHVATYLAKRYRVAEGAVRHIVGAAFSTGRSIGVDPLLILAVTAIESSLNPFAQSSMGAQGLMQVMTRVHSEKFVSHGGDHAALDPITNLKVGAEILRELIERGGSVERGLQLYVGAGNLPDDGGYSARVLGEMGRIKLAASGNVRSALSAGWRADNPPREKAGSAEPRPVSFTPAASGSDSIGGRSTNPAI